MIAPNEILKELSDLSAAADVIVTEKVSNLSRIEDWCALIKYAAEKRMEEGGRSSSSDSVEIPTLEIFLEERRPIKGQRVSTVLKKIGKEKLHRKKGKLSTSSQSSIGTPLKETTFLINQSPGRVDTPTELPADINQEANSSSSMVRKKVDPLHNNDRKVRSSKRKSSSELSPNTGKKAKIVEQEMDKKIEKLTKAISSIKSSVGSNTSVLKENHKKILNPPRGQQKKLYKRTLDGKDLEKKEAKLRSGGGMLKKTSTKTITPKANLENEIHNKGKQTFQKARLHNEKIPAKKNSKNETNAKAMNVTFVSQGQNEPSTSLGIKGKTVKGPNIVPYKSQTHSLKKVPKTAPKTGKSLKEQTASTPKTGKSLKEQMASPPKTGKSLKEQMASTPKTEEKGPTSYPITPARPSFVSYDITEIKSDSEDEEQSCNNKDVPSWAIGVQLRNRLLQLHHEPIDTDELFGNYIEPPDLVEIMGVTKTSYHRRTSSALWNSFIM